MPESIDAILRHVPVSPEAGDIIGTSRGGRSLRAFRLGSGDRRLSLIAGCHADEPVGPRFLRHFVSYLRNLPPNHHLIDRLEWWIVPHVNPDGAERNRPWQSADASEYALTSYLCEVVREAPGDDVEFGFPRDVEDLGARPETRAVYDWWRADARPFALHASLHGMGFAAGPWFLLDPNWRDRSALLRDRCAGETTRLGYTLHDVERRGEKGFVRIEQGFSTTPNAVAMREFFLAQNDPTTAAKFRPSSMETVGSLGGDPFTMVSEMPLFLLPGVGATLGPPDPVADEWKARIDDWRIAAREGRSVDDEATQLGLRPMPVEHQMQLQWTMISAGLAVSP